MNAAVSPVDDGACDHLVGKRLPALTLPATSGRGVSLAALPDRSVLYAYPRTSRPNEAPPSGWDEIPGARGCTPQSCSFRDHHGELKALGVRVFGLSSQGSDYQREAVERLQLPFELLSDADLALTEALRLPTFVADDMRLIKRLTLVVRDGQIETVFYPVFPADKHIDDVIHWLHSSQ